MTHEQWANFFSEYLVALKYWGEDISHPSKYNDVLQQWNYHMAYVRMGLGAEKARVGVATA